MKIEHITALTDDSQLRDRNDISKLTEEYFSHIKNEDGIYKLKDTPYTKNWEVRVTAKPFAVVFDILIDGKPISCNVCSLSEDKSKYMYTIANNLSKKLYDKEVIKPSQSLYMITLVIDFKAVIHLMTAGEIAFYIYNQFLLENFQTLKNKN